DETSSFRLGTITDHLSVHVTGRKRRSSHATCHGRVARSEHVLRSCNARWCLAIIASSLSCKLSLLSLEASALSLSLCSFIVFRAHSNILISHINVDNAPNVRSVRE